jgi:hypothetical protein
MSSTQNRAPVAAVDRPVPPPELLEAAALSLINWRCREAYLHEVRGGLHALYSALELLSRSASGGHGDASLVERATTMARRTMSNYEPLVLKTVDSLTALGHEPEKETTVDLGLLTDETLRFLRTDIANKQLELRATIDAGVRVRACRETARQWILGLLLTSVDGSPTGQALGVSVSRHSEQARLVIASAARRDAIPEWEVAPAVLPSRADAVILAMARRWAESRGGRVEFAPAGVAGDEIHVYYPLIAAAEPE